MSTFCLVHGAGLGAWCWDLLIPQLQARGHKAIAIDLPIEDASASLSQFADVVISALSGVDDVVLVGHSFSGAVIPLVATQHPVRQLVFLGALIPQVGMSLLDQCYDEVDPNLLTAAYKPPEASRFEQLQDEPDMFNRACLGKDPSNEAAAMELLFHDCEPDVARWAISKTRSQKSMAHLSEVTPLRALPDVDYAYIVCTEDRTISPVWSRYAARKRLGVEAIEIPGGHCPFLSRPTQLAEILVSAINPVWHESAIA